MAMPDCKTNTAIRQASDSISWEWFDEEEIEHGEAGHGKAGPGKAKQGKANVFLTTNEREKNDLLKYQAECFTQGSSSYYVRPLCGRQQDGSETRAENVFGRGFRAFTPIG